eukprot:Skav219067  [mRNA]  locus=scaffold1033:130047:137966:- [translate_table: standard]
MATAGGFPGGSRGPWHSSHAELENLRARLAQVTTGTAVYRTSTKCTDRDVVAHVEQGQHIDVEEVMNCLSEERVRGLISEPRG